MIAPNITIGMVLSCLQERNGKTVPVEKANGAVPVMKTLERRRLEEQYRSFGVSAGAGSEQTEVR
jgi:hypothetical protein